MLAAMTSKNEHSLDTFKLILVLQSQGKGCSSALQSYFNEVVVESFNLLDDPKSVAATAKSESVSLALNLSTNGQMREYLQRIIDKDEEAAKYAARVLDNLETTFDSNREFAHLSREVYAAI